MSISLLQINIALIMSFGGISARDAFISFSPLTLAQGINELITSILLFQFV